MITSNKNDEKTKNRKKTSLVEEMEAWDLATRKNPYMDSIVNDDICMVEAARSYLEFVKNESCDKCTICRVGKKRMLAEIETILAGKGTKKNLEKIENIAIQMKYTSFCELGHNAPNFVLSTLTHKDGKDYIAHIEKKKCQLGACANL